MARQESRVSVGSFVDPFEGLENAFAGYRKKLDADRKYEDSLARQKEEDRRWALTNARAEQGLQLRKDAAQATKDKLAKEAEKEAYLKGYDPSIGLHSNDVIQGLRGVGRDQQTGMATKAGTEIKAILSKYGAEGPEGISNLSQEDKTALGRELGEKAVGSVAMLDPTKENVEALVRRDVMQNTGDVAAADRMAKLYSGKYDAAADIVKQERLDTKARNEEIERKKRDLNRTLTLRNKLGKKVTKADKVKSFDEVREYIGKADVGSLDANAALSVAKQAEEKGASLSRIKQALQKLRTPAKFGLSGYVQDNGFTDIGKDVGKFMEFLKDNTSPVSSSGTRGLTATEISILNMPTTKARSLNDILAGRGEQAAIGGFGDNTLVERVVPEEKVVTKTTPKARQGTVQGFTPKPEEVLKSKEPTEDSLVEVNGILSELAKVEPSDIPTEGKKGFDLSSLSREELLAKAEVNNEDGTWASWLFNPGWLPGSESKSTLLTGSMVKGMDTEELRRAVANQELKKLLDENRSISADRVGIVNERRLDDAYMATKGLLGDTFNTNLSELKNKDRVAAEEFAARDTDRVNRLSQYTTDMRANSDVIRNLRQFVNKQQDSSDTTTPTSPTDMLDFIKMHMPNEGIKAIERAGIGLDSLPEDKLRSVYFNLLMQKPELRKLTNK